MLRARCTCLLLAVLLPAAVSAATYRGRSIDGPRYSASLVNDDLGALPNVEVKFSDHSVTVYLRGNSQLNLVLDEEDIGDPRHILAHDDRRGTDWEIDVHNLREAMEGAR